MSLPLGTILKQLEEPESIIPILKSLSKNIDDLGGSKSDINHLVSRTINLINSHNSYYKWCGVLTTQLLVNNYEILSNNGLKLINALIKVLETTNTNTNLKLFKATVECLNYLCDEIRGKPTLTREILTPKLPVIIQLYLNNLDLNPELIISSLCHIMSNHPTTFRPFGNKLNARLVEYLKMDFNNFPELLKQQISRAYALLPIIEKNEPETFWSNKINNVLKEIIDTISIFKDLLDFKQDSDYNAVISNQVFKLEDKDRLFEFLQVDISDCKSLFQISDRLQCLLYLLNGFITTNLNMCVKFPIGKLLTVIEALFGLNPRFLPFKRDIRDETIKKYISSIITTSQNSALSVVNRLAKVFGVSLVMYLSSILPLLETCIPVSQKSLDKTEIIANETFMRNLLKTTNNLLELVDLYQEPQQLVRFVDMALLLVEPRTTTLSESNKGQNQNGQGNKNKKKNKNSIPMSDLLSHGHLFDSEVPEPTIKVVRSVIDTIIKRMELPSTQYYKIMRYIIIEAVKSTNLNYSRSIPPELRKLLIDAVIFPGFEKISVLPIISTILGDDPLVSVFNNPKFPPLPQLIKTADVVEDEEDEDEEEEAQAMTVDESNINDIIRKRTLESGQSSDSSKRSKVEEMPLVELKEEIIDLPAQANQDNVLQFKQDIPKSPEVAPVKVTPAMTTVTESEITVTVDQSNDVDSDFEMPSIDIDDDSDGD